MASHRFTNEQREELFQYWYTNNRDIAATARKAGCQRRAIYRMIASGKWIDRAERVRAAAEKAAEKRLATEQAKHIKIADFIINKELVAYKERRIVTGNPFVIATMMRYKDEALADSDNAPPAPSVGSQTNITYNVTLTDLANHKEVNENERNRRRSNIIAALSNFGG